MPRITRIQSLTSAHFVSNASTTFRLQILFSSKLFISIQDTFIGVLLDLQSLSIFYWTSIRDLSSDNFV